MKRFLLIVSAVLAIASGSMLVISFVLPSAHDRALKINDHEYQGWRLANGHWDFVRVTIIPYRIVFQASTRSDDDSSQLKDADEPALWMSDAARSAAHELFCGDYPGIASGLSFGEEHWRLGRGILQLSQTTDWGINHFSDSECDAITRIPLLPLFLVLAIAPGIELCRIIYRRWWYIPSGHCRKCRYDLTGNTSGVCPECGERI